MMELLKPELIAPVVAWLCHEDCNDNGSIIEAAGGWAGKCEANEILSSTTRAFQDEVDIQRLE